MMNKRDYYSVRTGKLQPSKEIDLEVFKKLFLVIYRKLERDGFFQKHFGYECVDAGRVDGELGADIDGAIYIHLKKDDLYPVDLQISNYSEDDLFDVIEFLHDHCSKGIDGDYHSWNDCGWHYSKFDDAVGQAEYRQQLNYILKDYGKGFEISDGGEILHLPDSGLTSLIEAIPATDDIDNVASRIQKAILKFRRHSSSMDDRQDAIRELVDVLEYLRPKAKQYLEKKDESDLFNIANNYGIRHHNDKQKNQYDKAIWHTWMFYHYLSTIHALLHLIKKHEK